MVVVMIILFIKHLLFSGNSPSLLTNNNIVEVGSLQVGLKTPLPAKAIYTNTNTIRTYGE